LLVLAIFSYPLWHHRLWQQNKQKIKKPVVQSANTWITDVAAAAGALAIAALMCWDATHYNNRDSYVFPVTVAIAMTVFSVLLARQAIANRSTPNTSKNITTTADDEAKHRIAVVLMSVIGFLPAAIATATATFIRPSIKNYCLAGSSTIYCHYRFLFIIHTCF
jgi:hypothetical protein